MKNINSDINVDVNKNINIGAYLFFAPMRNDIDADNLADNASANNGIMTSINKKYGIYSSVIKTPQLNQFCDYTYYQIYNHSVFR